MLRIVVCGLALAAASTASAQMAGAPAARPLGAVLAPLLSVEGVPVAPATRRDPQPASLVQKGVAQAAKASDLQTRRVVSGVMVRFASEEAKHSSRSNAPPPAALLQAVQAAAGVELAYRRPMGLDMFVFGFPTLLTIAEAQAVLARIAALPGVEHVDLDVRAQTRFIPTDPLLVDQHNLAPETVLTGGINAWDAWNLTTGYWKNVVAVVDSGIRFHEEFRGRLLPGYDFVTDPFSANDGDGRDANASDPGDWLTSAEAAQRACGTSAESSWHGTHVAGIIGAEGNNGRGIAGIDWTTRLLPVRVAGKCGAAVSDVLDGMLWAAGVAVPQAPANPTPAQVINLSLGAYAPLGCNATIQRVIQSVKAKGAVIVVAAGNESDEAGRYVPASCQGVITVGAVDPFGFHASYSNYSLQAKVALSAPGGDSFYGADARIWSTVHVGSMEPVGESFGPKEGTSMAAPHVAGVASLVIAANANLSGAEIAAVLQVTAHGFDPKSFCTTEWPICGAGIVNATYAVRAAIALRPYTVVTEFYNPDYRHYFRTGDRNEPAIVESGVLGNWINTEDYFVAWRDGSQGASPVCRFYSARFNSHFYTVQADECEAVKRNPDWGYEGIAFYAKIPVDGACPPDTAPVHRFYNNRHAHNDGNHRLTQYRDYYLPTLTAQGWIDEGVKMCVVGL
jgi:serine protease